MDTYEISVIGIWTQEIHCVPEIVCSLLCKVQLLFTYQGVYIHSLLHSPSLNCYSFGSGEYTQFVHSSVDTYNTKVL